MEPIDVSEMGNRDCTKIKQVKHIALRIVFDVVAMPVIKRPDFVLAGACQCMAIAGN